MILSPQPRMNVALIFMFNQWSAENGSRHSLVNLRSAEEEDRYPTVDPCSAEYRITIQPPLRNFEARCRLCEIRSMTIIGYPLQSIQSSGVLRQSSSTSIYYWEAPVNICDSEAWHRWFSCSRSIGRKHKDYRLRWTDVVKTCFDRFREYFS